MWTMFQNELQGTMDKLEKTDENLSAIVNKAYIIAAQNGEVWRFIRAAGAGYFLWKAKPCMAA